MQNTDSASVDMIQTLYSTGIPTKYCSVYVTNDCGRLEACFDLSIGLARLPKSPAPPYPVCAYHAKGRTVEPLANMNEHIRKYLAGMWDNIVTEYAPGSTDRNPFLNQTQIEAEQCHGFPIRYMVGAETPHG